MGTDERPRQVTPGLGRYLGVDEWRRKNQHGTFGCAPRPNLKRGGPGPGHYLDVDTRWRRGPEASMMNNVRKGGRRSSSPGRSATSPAWVFGSTGRNGQRNLMTVTVIDARVVANAGAGTAS